MHIYIIDRITGVKIQEAVFGQKWIVFLYGTSFLARTCGRIVRFCVSRIPCFSSFYGWLQTRPASKKNIAPFIKKFHIDSSEFCDPVSHFSSFNDFFIRKLKKEARPIAQGETIAVMPADGRYLFFPKLEHRDPFMVKGKRCCLDTVLADTALAKQYHNGTLIIARLCPTDCHRFYFPFDCTPSQPRRINGSLFSVNPIATKKNPWIWTENKRVLTLLGSPLFGTVACIEVGATNAGTIIQTYRSNRAHKGDEKGYFSFGGSAILLFFEEGRIALDADLLEKGAHGYEVRCLIGQSLGTACYCK